MLDVGYVYGHLTREHGNSGEILRFPRSQNRDLGHPAPGSVAIDAFLKCRSFGSAYPIDFVDGAPGRSAQDDTLIFLKVGEVGCYLLAVRRRRPVMR